MVYIKNSDGENLLENFYLEKIPESRPVALVMLAPQLGSCPDVGYPGSAKQVILLDTARYPEPARQF